MSGEPTRSRARRADAERNREKLLAAARAAFADSTGEVSMAEVARRAGVGMATLYRNFPNRQALLMAVYVDDVDAVCAAAEHAEGATPGAAFAAWLRRFFAFIYSKRPVGAELLKEPGAGHQFLDAGRDRIFAAGQPLLEAAQRAGEVRTELTLEQVLELVVAVARIEGDQQFVEPVLQTVLDGLRAPS
jgi:AcrR family transcriptional regulator